MSKLNTGGGEEVFKNLRRSLHGREHLADRVRVLYLPRHPTCCLYPLLARLPFQVGIGARLEEDAASWELGSANLHIGLAVDGSGAECVLGSHKKHAAVFAVLGGEQGQAQVSGRNVVQSSSFLEREVVGFLEFLQDDYTTSSTQKIR